MWKSPMWIKDSSMPYKKKNQVVAYRLMRIHRDSSQPGIMLLNTLNAIRIKHLRYFVSSLREPR
jgi:hypothetical protein